MRKFEKELKQAVRESGTSFDKLEYELKGKRTGDLSRRLKSYGEKINKVLNHIGYELTISHEND